MKLEDFLVRIVVKLLVIGYLQVLYISFLFSKFKYSFLSAFQQSSLIGCFILFKKILQQFCVGRTGGGGGDPGRIGMGGKWEVKF